MNRIVRFAAALAVALPLAAAAAPELQSNRALARRLRQQGRAEATVRYTVTDPARGEPIRAAGRLALERPGFARLDLDTGERLTLREDGGDWLQPGTRQLVRAGARSAGGVLAWWGILLDGDVTRFREAKLGARHFVVRARDAGGESDGQHVWLDAAGLPARVEVRDGDVTRSFRLSAWRFTRPRGRTAFVLDAPSGWETVELP